jgi:hypothetical protein
LNHRFSKNWKMNGILIMKSPEWNWFIFGSHIRPDPRGSLIRPRPKNLLRRFVLRTDRRLVAFPRPLSSIFDIIKRAIEQQTRWERDGKGSVVTHGGRCCRVSSASLPSFFTLLILLCYLFNFMIQGSGNQKVNLLWC